MTLWALVAHGYTLPPPVSASDLLSLDGSNARSFTPSPSFSTTEEVLEFDLRLRSQSPPLSRAPGTFSATWKNGQTGYNISIPHNICADGIVGDFTSPSGAITTNATFEDIFQSVYRDHHTSSFLSNYIITHARDLQTKLDTLLSSRICNLPSGGSRHLLYTVDPDTVDGYWTATIINTLAGGTIAVGGIYGAISTNITYFHEATALAGVGAIEYVLYRLIDRLQEAKYFSKIEAYVMSVFITAGQNIYQAMRSCASSSCCGSGTCACMSGGDFLQSFADLWRATKLQVLSCCGSGAARTGISAFGSSANLVAQGGAVDLTENC